MVVYHVPNLLSLRELVNKSYKSSHMVIKKSRMKLKNSLKHSHCSSIYPEHLTVRVKCCHQADCQTPHSCVTSSYCAQMGLGAQICFCFFRFDGAQLHSIQASKINSSPFFFLIYESLIRESHSYSSSCRRRSITVTPTYWWGGFGTNWCNS